MPHQSPECLTPHIICLSLCVSLGPYCSAVNLWSDHTKGNQSSRKKIQPVKVHGAVERAAAVCSAGYKYTVSKYRRDQSYDPTFTSHNRAKDWLASGSPFSVSTLLFDECHFTKAFELFFFSFFLSLL